MKILRKWFCAGALALAVGGAQAAPVSFGTVNYVTSTLTIAGSDIQADDDDSGISPLPLASSSSAAEAGASAAATAGAAPGSVSAQASATGGVGLDASATASANFSGLFSAPGGLLSLIVDVVTGTSATGDSSGDGLVRVTLTAGADTLVDEIVRQTMQYTALLNLAAGTLGSLSIEAIGTAAAQPLDPGAPVGGENAAGGTAQASFAFNQVPEPGSWALLIASALVMFLSSKQPARSRLAAEVGIPHGPTVDNA
jgi:hypothetical protein